MRRRAAGRGRCGWSPWGLTLPRRSGKDDGITLPSLGVDLPGFAGVYGVSLVALGNCIAATARRLTEVLRKVAAR
ncbi:hypothetical protein Sliba_46430 [Streptomyces nigrescens]|uniref:Uncharacterized protein n=1 Tax=Streptomyces nigrescens TaxID=1920 RepID=A0A640TLY7_STRNI|nr:hypothetical protein Sliba_46430 [Streptomyces libani subsp. libani]GGW00137.1 hypothetical protein GCM10010500_52530 [Streptomyces libani subsp. libani]